MHRLLIPVFAFRNRHTGTLAYEQSLNSISQTLNRLQSGAIMGYSSMYTVNQDDLHPVVGETSVTGLWACNGFSGHGFKLAPAIGSMVAQQVTLSPKS
jgi:glycine/D-amino acid oxidase-like deaminating enzyme